MGQTLDTRPDSSPGSARLEATAAVRIGEVTVVLDVADTPDARSFGLQGRTSLADGDGMLFVYETPRRVTFARKTVPFPLDVLFVDPGGHITDIAPLDETRDLARSPGPVTHVIEVAGGWSAEHAIGVGDAVEVLTR